MTITLKVRNGLSAPLVNSIPQTWDPQWFRRWITDFLNTQQINSGVSSIIAGSGISITPSSGTGAVTISSSIGALVGTANEITVTSSGGTTTLAFAPNVVIPAPASGIPFVVHGLAAQTVAQFLSVNTNATTDFSISRGITGTANAVATGANIQLNSGTAPNATLIQNAGGQTEFWQYSGGWNEVMYCDTSFNWHIVDGLFVGTGLVVGTTLTMTNGVITRSNNDGFLHGGYNTVETGNTAGCIYSIGSVYVPNQGTTNALGQLYGVGFTLSSAENGNGTTIASTAAPNGALPSGRWGMYASSGGIARIFLDTDDGAVFASGSLQSAGVICAGAFVGSIAGDISANRGGSGAIFLGTTANYVYFSGSAYSFGGGQQVQAGSFEATSDRTMKQRIRPIKDALAKLSTLAGVTFEWNARAGKTMRGKRSAGLIAQDVERVLPDAVSTADADPHGKKRTHKVLNYNGPIGLLVNAVNELRERVEQLERS